MDRASQYPHQRNYNVAQPAKHVGTGDDCKTVAWRLLEHRPAVGRGRGWTEAHWVDHGITTDPAAASAWARAKPIEGRPPPPEASEHPTLLIEQRPLKIEEPTLF